MSLFTLSKVGSGQELKKFVEAHWKHLGAEPWAILESVTELRLTRPGSVTGVNVQGTMAGRVFGERGEIRWVRDGFAYQYWILSDSADAGGTEVAHVRVQANRYYFLGSKKDGQYTERHLQVSLDDYYAMVEGEGDQRRPFVVVNEYRPVRRAAGSWEELESALNQPVILAYRLTGIDAE